jgi:exonuclease III
MGDNKEMIKICSINVWGLLDETKRNKIYMWLETHKYDIIFIQETHCTDEDKVRINRNCPGKMYHSVTDSKNSRGVAIVIANNFNHVVLNCNTDNDGRRIMLQIDHNGKELSLINLYAPNKQKNRKLFFTRCEKWIKKHNKTGPNIILGGDMNCCLNDDDRTPVTHLNDQSRKSFKKLVDAMDIKDSWENVNNEVDKFTWYSVDKTIKSRLDYLFLGRDCIYHQKTFKPKP